VITDKTGRAGDQDVVEIKTHVFRETFEKISVYRAVHIAPPGQLHKEE
jgi:hypothetical protein